MPKDSKSVLALPKLKAQNSRNPFDLSYKTVFNAPFGMLLPCGFWRVDEGDYLEINNELQLVNDTILRPAFMRLKTHVDYFFVPYSQLWKPFDNFVTGQNNYESSAVSYFQENNDGMAQVPNSVPMFSGTCLKRALDMLARSEDEHGYKEHFGAVRLLDFLGYGNYFGLQRYMGDTAYDAWPDNANPSYIPYQNLFALLAYQKIYYDHYRNRRYEDCDVKAYNIDDMQSNMILGDTDSDAERLAKMLRVHYRWLKKDYFTQVQPSVLPDTNTIGFEGLTNIAQQGYSIYPSMFNVPGAVYPGAVSQNLTNSQQTGPMANNQGHYTTSIYPNSVANIRLAFAYDKLLRRMRNASGSFSAQMLAQFGVAPKDYRGGEVRKLGGFTSRVYPTDVTSTADYNNTLGKIGGQINQYAQQQKPIKFKIEENGIVMAIFSTSLDNDYQSFRYNRANLSRQRFDWFNPAFENLGLQPLFLGELTSVNPQDLVEGSIANESINTLTSDNGIYSILGFIPRYSDQKTHVDEVHGLFCKFNDKPSYFNWTTQFVLDRDEMTDTQAPIYPLSIHYLTCNPKVFDTVISVQFNGDQTTDPFKVNMYHSCRVMSNKSVNGETF